MKIRRSEKWRKDYVLNRYMEFLSEEKLKERTKNIIDNLTTLTDKGLVGFIDPEIDDGYWVQLFNDILNELELRGLNYNLFFGKIGNLTSIKPTHPFPPKSFIAIQSIGGRKKGAIYKFGKYQHLKEMYERGTIRISPASYYNDPSLNHAIHDDELSFTQESRGDNFTIKGSDGSLIAPIGNIQFQKKSHTNYFVHCFAAQYSNREFDDFEADCCIVIQDPDKLFQKMMESVASEKPEYLGAISSVKYVDPLQSRHEDIDVFFTKHFKYCYQNEIRTIWIPPSAEVSLEPFLITVGNMEEYAKIIKI